MRLRLLCAALAALQCTVACGGPSAEAPSVLVVTIDCLRADHVGAYGYERDTTPNLDALAEEAALFERSYSQAPFTAPSHASLFTGLNVPSHGLVFWGHRMDPGADTMAELFGAAGYETGAFQNHPGLVPTGLLDDFDAVVTEIWGPAEQTVSNYFEWLDGFDGRSAAWVHLWDVHRPYGYREWSKETWELFGEAGREPQRLPYAEQGFGDGQAQRDPRVGRLEAHYNLNRAERASALPVGPQGRPFGADDWAYIGDRYDNSVRVADRGLGALVEGLRERGLLDSTILVVTADHGETLTERDPVWFTHDPFLYEETLRVPLVVRFPDGRFAGARSDALARGIDVLPTLLAAAGLELPGTLQGRDLSPVLGGTDTDPVMLFAQTQTRTAKETDARVEAPGWIEHRQAVSDGRHKLIVDLNTGALEFYDLEADPGERDNLMVGQGSAPEPAQALRAELTRVRQTLPMAAVVPSSMTPEEEERERERLRVMGYLDDESEGGR